MKFIGGNASSITDIHNAIKSGLDNAFGTAVQLVAANANWSATYKTQITSELYLVWRTRLGTDTGSNNKGRLDAAITTTPTFSTAPPSSDITNGLYLYLYSYETQDYIHFMASATASTQTIVVASSATLNSCTIYAGGSTLIVSKDFIFRPATVSPSETTQGTADYYTPKQYRLVNFVASSNLFEYAPPIIRVINPDTELLEPTNNAGLFVFSKTKSGVTTIGALDTTPTSCYAKTWSPAFQCLTPAAVPVVIGGKIIKQTTQVLIAQPYEANLAIGGEYFIGTDEYCAIPCHLIKVD